MSVAGRLHLLVWVGVWCASAGCGGGNGADARARDGSVESSTRGGVTTDATVKRDGGGDARPDAGREAAHDAPADTRPDDVVSDAEADAPRDAPLDAIDDAIDDGGHDAAPDSRTDAQADAGVTSIAVSPLALVPAFSPDIHDYYMRCATGSNDVTVTTSAAAGSTIHLTLPVTTAPSSGATRAVDVAENGAIVAEVVTGEKVAEYWIRCLPHDFPPFHWAAYPEAGALDPGYYLVGDFIAPAGSGSYAMAVDTHGVPVWYKSVPPQMEGFGTQDITLLRRGTIAYAPVVYFTFATTGGAYSIDDLDAGTTTTLGSKSAPTDMHELLYLPESDTYLVFTDPIRTGVDLTGLQGFGSDENVIGCLLQEITPSGEEVWEWDAFDHFDPVEDTRWVLTYSVDSKQVVDIFHCNSIALDPSGNVLVSARHMDSVFVVGRGGATDGQVLWKLGGSAHSLDPNTQFLTVTHDPETTFYRQHDARFLDGGGLSMFDDHTAVDGGARAVSYALDFDAGSAQLVWQYGVRASSAGMGSVRRQPGGGTVIGWGYGATSVAFTELDPDDEVLAQLTLVGGGSYRAVKVPAAELDLNALRRSAGTP